MLTPQERADLARRAALARWRRAKAERRAVSVFRPPYKDPKTGERRQSRVWWYEFWVGGRRIRESARTTRKTVAIEAENRRRAALELHTSRYARWFGPIKADWYVFPAMSFRHRTGAGRLILPALWGA
jgi:hypothetical protein